MGLRYDIEVVRIFTYDDLKSGDFFMFRGDPIKGLCFRTDGGYCEMISGRGSADLGELVTVIEVIKFECTKAAVFKEVVVRV